MNNLHVELTDIPTAPPIAPRATRPIIFPKTIAKYLLHVKFPPKGERFRRSSFSSSLTSYCKFFILDYRIKIDYSIPLKHQKNLY